MDRVRQAQQVVTFLRSEGLGCALVGGVAVAIRAQERFTKDLDFAVAVSSDEQAEALALAMQHRGYRLTTVIEQEAMGVIATLRFRDPTSALQEPTVDLLCQSCGIEREIVAAATEVELAPGVALPVARIPHLIAMKLLSASDIRYQDKGDLRVLFAAAGAQDLAEARQAIALIASRGFHRDRDLVADFEKLSSKLR